MTDAPQYLKDLSRRVEPAPSASEVSDRRLEMIRSIEQSARSTRRVVAASRRRRIYWSAGAAAAAALLTIGLWRIDRGETIPGASSGVTSEETSGPRPPAGKAELTTPTEPEFAQLLGGSVVERGREPLSAGDPIGERPLSVESKASIRLRSGAELSVVGDSRLQLRSRFEGARVRSEIVGLDVGDLSLSVPHLGAKQRLFVRTKEALVEVRGTAFKVERRKSPQTAAMVTRVSVSEGLVSVSALAASKAGREDDKEIFLRPGEHWESGTSVREGSRSAAPSTPSFRVDATSRETKSASAPEQRASELARQNKMYQSAVLASRNGFDDLARVRFEELLQKYPDSPLASGARRELDRLNKSHASQK